MTKPEYMDFPFDPDTSLNYLLTSYKSEIKLPPVNSSSDFTPVFVIGSPRSGTTLIGNCIGNHSKIANGEESLFLIDFWRLFSDLYIGNNHQSWKPLNKFIEEEKILGLIKDFSSTVLNSYLNKKQCGIYLDHTPWYILLMPFIKDLFPNSVFIHVLRDGRDVVRSLSNSYSKGFLWAGKNIKERTKLWNDLVKFGYEHGRTMPKSQYLELKYEDFIIEPEKELNSVFDLLNLIYERKCILPLNEEHASPSREHKTIVSLNNKTLNFSEFKRHAWENHWNQKDKEVFLKYGKDTLKRIGYTID